MFYVYTIRFLFDKMIIQIKHISVIKHINKPINSMRFLKKNIILLLCVCFPFFSFFSQSEEVDLLSCSNGKFTQFFYPSGKVSSEGCLVEGKAEGVWVSFFESGQTKSKGNYLNNKLQGVWFFYFESGQKEKELSYSNDQKNGIEKSFSEEGILLIQTNWVNNIKDGEELRFFESGELQHVTFFKEGKKDGKCRQHAKDGRIITFKTYRKGVIFSTERFNRFDKKGRKTGVWKEFFETLVVSEEGPFVDGLKHGIFRTYDKRGNLINIERFKFGELVIDDEILDPIEVVRLYHPNGQCSEETVYKKGVKHGVFRLYNKKGEIIEGGVYEEGFLKERGITDKSGNKQGDWIIYYKSGATKAIGHYIDGLREGEWVFFYESGEEEQRGFYKKGEYDGVWVWVFKNGGEKRFEHYIKGVEHGEFLEFDSIGNILLNGNYINGLREGEWLYHVNDHKEEGLYISGQKDGEWIHTFTDGTVIFKGSFSYDSPVGTHKVWSSKGILISSGKFKNGLKNGKWILNKEKGEVDHEYKYRNGDLIKVDGRKVNNSKQS